MSKLNAKDKKTVKENAANFLKDLFTGIQAVLRNTLPVITMIDHFSIPKFLEIKLEREHLVAPFFPQDEKLLDEARPLISSSY